MIPALEGVQLVSASCGQQHTCAIDAQGRCYSWGLGSFGQLGHGGFSDEPRPRKVLRSTWPHLPTSPYISLHLPTSPYISLHLPTSPYISPHLPTSPYISRTWNMLSLLLELEAVDLLQ